MKLAKLYVSRPLVGDLGRWHVGMTAANRFFEFSYHGDTDDYQRMEGQTELVEMYLSFENSRVRWVVLDPYSNDGRFILDDVIELAWGVMVPTSVTWIQEEFVPVDELTLCWVTPTLKSFAPDFILQAIWQNRFFGVYDASDTDLTRRIADMLRDVGNSVPPLEEPDWETYRKNVSDFIGHRFSVLIAPGHDGAYLSLYGTSSDVAELLGRVSIEKVDVSEAYSQACQKPLEDLA